MTNSNKNFQTKVMDSFKLENLFKPSNFKSFKILTLFIPFFLLLPLAYLIKDLIKIDSLPFLYLKRINIDILPLHQISQISFAGTVICETLLLISAILISINFIHFVRSIDIADPFKNQIDLVV